VFEASPSKIGDPISTNGWCGGMFLSFLIPRKLKQDDSYPGQVIKTLIKKSCEFGSVVVYVPHKHNSLSSNPGTTQKRKV
jgi:hypothetical protein